MIGVRSSLLVAYSLAMTHACSNFLLESGGSDFVVSARTMDLGPGLSFGVSTAPAGSKIGGANLGSDSSDYGFVGFVPIEAGLVLEHFVTAGMNTAGVSCDQQTLLGTVYPNKTGNASEPPPSNNPYELDDGILGAAEFASSFCENSTSCLF